jgi:hypothetical protein
MRKVLLATTALATVSAVAAANAEVTLKGYYKFIYSSISDNTSYDSDGMSDDTEFSVTFSKTTDSGLTFGMQTQVEGGTGSGDSTIDEGFMTISTPEMGKLILGDNDDTFDQYVHFAPGLQAMASGTYDGASAYTAEYAGDPDTAGALPNGLVPDAGHTSGSDSTKASYISPSMSGLSVGVTYMKAAGTEDAFTSMGISYSTEIEGVSLDMSAATKDNNKDNNSMSTQYGMTVGFGDFAIGAATFNVDSKAGTSGTDNYEGKATTVGASYKLTDSMTIAYSTTTSEVDAGNDVGDELDTDSFGVNYTIASGLSLAVAFNSSAYSDSSAANNSMDTDEVRAELTAKF